MLSPCDFLPINVAKTWKRLCPFVKVGNMVQNPPMTTTMLLHTISTTLRCVLGVNLNDCNLFQPFFWVTLTLSLQKKTFLVHNLQMAWKVCQTFIQFLPCAFQDTGILHIICVCNGGRWPSKFLAVDAQWSPTSFFQVTIRHCFL
jgi:hypothetical protein